MSRYPILVSRLPADKALMLACGDCEITWTPDDPDEFMRIVDSGCCPVCGSFDTMGAYEEADACPNCGKLAFDLPASLAGHCSRSCMLQSEYKASLEGKK